MFDFDIRNFQFLFSLITFFISTALGALTYVKDRKSWTNRFFGLLAFLIDAYIVVNFLSLNPPIPTPENQLFWIRVVMFVCSFIGPTLLFLVCSFPGRQFGMKIKYVWPVLILMFTSAAFSLLPFVFRSIEYPNGVPVPVVGPGISIFMLDFVGLFIISFIVLVHKYRKSSGQERAKMFLFLLGVFFTFTMMGVFTVIAVVVFKTSAGVFLGPISFVILSAFVAFAIIKHGLFNVKVLTTKILMMVLFIIFFARIFVFESIQQSAVDLFLFLIVCGFGLGLIKSVVKEVNQKEELSLLASSLKKANASLQELDQQKTEFLSIASHQLRTPLSIIKGYIELIKDGGYGKVTKATVEILNNMDDSNQRLVNLVDDFLNITRIEQGRTKFDFTKNNINEIVDSVVKELEPRAEQNGLKIVWKIPIVIIEASCDQEKIRNIVFNYIDNAIKYTEKGQIKVLLEKHDNGVVIRVKDTGFGFGECDQVNFFQKFFRGENVRGTNVTGTGLGLYVCRKFIEAHGGEIWAKSQGLKKGSEFGFWIPFVPKPKT